MLGVAQISEHRFATLLECEKGNLRSRSIGLFQNYGPLLRRQTADVLIKASQQGKLREVLSLLELHYKNHLEGHPRDTRGSIQYPNGINPTEIMFSWLYEKVLGLQPDFT